MGKITAQFDTHIHTEGTSPYKKGDSNLLPYHKHGSEKNLEGICITDHFHYITQDPSYLFEQRKHIDEMDYKKPQIMLGTEQTILGGKGKLAIRRKTIPILDMLNVSIHWFGVGMPGLFCGTRFGEKDLFKIADYVKTKDKKSNKIFAFMSKSYINAIQSKKVIHLPIILGHIWDNFFSHGLFFEEMLTHTEKVASAMRERECAFEFNNGTCEILLKYWNEEGTNDQGNQPYVMNPREFLTHLVGILNDNSLWITFASDAHQLKDIGDLRAAEALVDTIGKKTSVKNLKIVNDQFFNLT